MPHQDVWLSRSSSRVVSCAYRDLFRGLCIRLKWSIRISVESSPLCDVFGDNVSWCLVDVHVQWHFKAKYAFWKSRCSSRWRKCDRIVVKSNEIKNVFLIPLFLCSQLLSKSVTQTFVVDSIAKLLRLMLRCRFGLFVTIGWYHAHIPKHFIRHH